MDTELEYEVHNNWLMVWKKDKTDGISWDALQTVKNKAFGEEAIAIEVYPAQSQLINLKNVRHLWLITDEYRDKIPNLKNHLKKTK